MKKISLILLFVVFFGFLMIFYVGNIAEKEIKAVISESEHSDISVELISYQRHFFTATAITQVMLHEDGQKRALVKVVSDISHYPHQAVINNNIEIADAEFAKYAQNYFGIAQWVTSREVISLSSQVSGRLTVVAGQYQNEKEAISTEPVLLDYQFDLKSKTGDINLSWAGMKGKTVGTAFNVKSLQLTSHLGLLSKQTHYDYQVSVEQVEVQQDSGNSLLEGVLLQGNSQQGSEKQTIDTSNALAVRSYQINQQTFTDNRFKLTLSGLYEPAFALLHSDIDDLQEVEGALIELVNHGLQLSLSQLTSQTPWGEVDGQLDFTLDKGASLIDIIVNPYILFDYASGDASLFLPATLLDEPSFSELLQLGLMTGFLEEKEQTLSLQTSFQQGELIVNGQVIPL